MEKPKGRSPTLMLSVSGNGVNVDVSRTRTGQVYQGILQSLSKWPESAGSALLKANCPPLESRMA